MKLNRRIIAVLALACVLTTSVFSGCAFASPNKKAGTGKTAPVKAAVAEQTKDLLTRLLEGGSLTQKNVDGIKAYLQANPAASNDSKAGKKFGAKGKDVQKSSEDNAALKKLSVLVKDGKVKQKVFDSLTDLVNKEAAGKSGDEISAKLTQTVLDAMVKASVITERESAAIVSQMIQDMLDVALNGKAISQKDIDTIQAALNDAPATKK